MSVPLGGPFLKSGENARFEAQFMNLNSHPEKSRFMNAHPKDIMEEKKYNGSVDESSPGFELIVRRKF